MSRLVGGLGEPVCVCVCVCVCACVCWKLLRAAKYQVICKHFQVQLVEDLCLLPTNKSCMTWRSQHSLLQHSCCPLEVMQLLFVYVCVCTSV